MEYQKYYFPTIDGLQASDTINFDLLSSKSSDHHSISIESSSSCNILEEQNNNDKEFSELDSVSKTDNSQKQLENINVVNQLKISESLNEFFEKSVLDDIHKDYLIDSFKELLKMIVHNLYIKLPKNFEEILDVLINDYTKHIKQNSSLILEVSKSEYDTHFELFSNLSKIDNKKFNIEVKPVDSLEENKYRLKFNDVIIDKNLNVAKKEIDKYLSS